MLEPAMHAGERRQGVSGGGQIDAHQPRGSDRGGGVEQVVRAIDAPVPEEVKRVS